MESASDVSSLNDLDGSSDEEVPDKDVKLSPSDVGLISNLASSGPEGVSAAAAIVSMKQRRKVHHDFERDPIMRRRKKTQLLRKLLHVVKKYISKAGEHVVFMTVSPKPNGFKAFGTVSLMKAVAGVKDSIIREVKMALDEKVFLLSNPTEYPLPPLISDGLPTTINKMTQSQLRSFIPHMIKCCTRKSMIGWGRVDTKPVWWPTGLPWASIRLDMRSQKEKEEVGWSHVLRQIVINCYRHYGKEHFLYSFGRVNNQETSTSEKIEWPLDDVAQKNVSSEDFCDSINLTYCREEVVGCEGDFDEECVGEEGSAKAVVKIDETPLDWTVQNADVSSTESALTDLGCTLDDDGSPVTADAPANPICIDRRGCVDAYLTYIIPLIRVQSSSVDDKGETLQTFAFAPNTAATHSLLVQVNDKDDIFLN